MEPGLPRPQPSAHVHPTPWIYVGSLALAVEAALLLVAAVEVVRSAWLFVHDPMLFILALIVVPAMVFFAAFAVGAAGWLILVVTRLLAADRDVRLDTTGAAVIGAIAAATFASMHWWLLTGLITGSSLALAVVAIVPDAWRIAEPEEMADR